MSKKSNKQNEVNIIEKNNTEVIDDLTDIENNIEEIQENIDKKYEEQMCKVLWVKPNSFAFSFVSNNEEYGISVHTENNSLLDIEKISNYVKVQYAGQIGSPDFKYFVVYD